MAVFSACDVDLAGAIEEIEAFVGGFDFDVLHGDDAKRLVGLFARGQRLCGAGKALAARRVEATGAHRGDGEESMPKWLAARSGITAGEAERQLRTVQRLGELPATADAYRSGELSDEQAEHVASGASADPSSEGKLLASARNDPVARLAKKAREARASAAGDKALGERDRIHQSRYLRTWVAGDGAFEGRFRLSADAGAVLATALEDRHDVQFHDARRRGERCSFEQLEADALVAVAAAALRPVGLVPSPSSPGSPSSSGSPSSPGSPGSSGSPSSPGSPGPGAMVIFRVDYQAYLRGFTVAGETCEADRTGPVPVETVRKAASDAVLRAVLLDGDGETIRDVVHIGRTIPSRLRTALCERDRCCVVPGCQADRHLEIHHLDPIGRGGPTSLANTCRICSFHHDQITYRGATLTGGPPDWQYTPSTSAST